MYERHNFFPNAIYLTWFCTQDTFARAHSALRPSARATIGYIVYKICFVPDKTPVAGEKKLKFNMR